jgi:hypothetical protein
VTHSSAIGPRLGSEGPLLEALGGLPTGPLRDAIVALIRDLAAFVADPGCPERQADGVPCASAQAACDECRRVIGVLEDLRRRLRAG